MRPRVRPRATCSPSASEPVANVSSLPETAGAGAAMPSSSAPGAVTGSEAVRTIWFAEARRMPSAGAAERSCRRGVVEADVRRGARPWTHCRAVVADRAQVVEAVGRRSRCRRAC